MSHLRLRIITMFAAVSLSCGVCFNALGQSAPPGGGYELLPRGLLALELSTDEITAVRTILQDTQETARSYSDTLRELRKELDTAINKDVVDEAAVRQAAQNSAAAEEEFFVFKANVVAHIRAVLTSDHRAELDLLSSSEEIDAMGFGPPPHGGMQQPVVES